MPGNTQSLPLRKNLFDILMIIEWHKILHWQETHVYNDIMEKVVGDHRTVMLATLIRHKSKSNTLNAAQWDIRSI